MTWCSTLAHRRPALDTLPMQFRATIELGGKTATGIRVPEDIVTALGAGKRPAVTVSIGDYSYRSTIAPMSGAYFIPFASEHREATGLAAGVVIDVIVELDTAPREVTVPGDFAAALAANDAARDFFESLSYSNRRRLVLAIEAAKAEATRQRRIESTVANLAIGKA